MREEVTTISKCHTELDSLTAVGTIGSLNNTGQFEAVKHQSNVGTINHKNSRVAARVRGFSKMPITPTLNQESKSQIYCLLGGMEDISTAFKTLNETLGPNFNH